MSRRATLSPVIGQVGLVLAAFGALVMLPPTRGRLWLVPVSAAGRARLVPLALAGGARLVAAGPIAGSLVVDGARGRLWRPLLGAGVLVLAPPPVGCDAGPGAAP